MEKEELLDIPEMPESFPDSVLTKEMIIFVGAGVSKLCEFPLWNDLANDLVEHFRKEKFFDYSLENAIRKGNYSPIQKITILSNKVGKNGNTDLVSEKICECLKYENCNDEKAKRIASLLFSFNSTIVTTNADQILERNDINNTYNTYNSVEELPSGDIPRQSIIHLHGSIAQKETLVFTERQYAIKYYPDKEIGKVLNKILKDNRTILFVGYSLSEFELLKYLIDPDKEKKNKRLFKLEAYYKNEKDTRLKLDEAYYDELGIKLLPYFIDKKGYEALFDVLEDWVNRINDQISPAGLLHLDIAAAISKKPSVSSKIIVISKIDGANPIFIQETIIKSKYYKGWIKVLWNATPFFNPEPYFVASPSTDDTTRTFWSGLLILRDYVEKGSNDKIIEQKLLHLMRRTGHLIRKNKPARETHKNIDSISILLFDLVLSRPEFINDSKIFNPIAELYISENQYGAYTLTGEIFNKKDYLIKNVSSKRLFDIVCFVASSKKNEKEHYEALNSGKIKDFIMMNPELYYKEALTRLKKTDWLFANIGSFLHFPAENNNFMYEQRMYGAWLLIAAPYIDLNLLKKDIEILLKTKNEILNKIGLCLIGLRFEDFKDLFLEKIDTFFNRYQYAADLIQLLINNSETIREDKDIGRIIKDNLDKAGFGCKNDAYKEIIKKATSNALSSIIPGFLKYDLSETEKEIIFHLDSSASFFSIDTNKEVKTIYEKLKDKDIEEVILYIKELKNGKSYFFDTSVRKAIDMYLEKKDYSSYKDRIKDIGESYLLSYLSNTDFVSIDNEGIQKFLYLYPQLKDENKKESMTMLLFTCQKMIVSEEIDKNYKEQLIKTIDYKLIEIRKIEEQEIKIGTVINTSLHLYWSVLYDLKKFDEKLAVDTLLGSVHYYYGLYKDEPLFKAVMASWFAFIYYYEDETTRENYFEYAFNEEDCNTSFRIFSYLNGTNWYLKKLCDLESFNSFVSNRDDDSQERVTLASRVVLLYLFNNELETTYRKIMSGYDIEVIERSFYPIVKNSDDFIKGQIKTRFNGFLDACIANFKTIDKRTFSINQVLKFLVDMMIKEKEGDLTKIWDFLVLLPKGLSYYHDDSILKLIDTFTETNNQNCKRFLNALFESYDSFFISDTYLIELFNRLKIISSFRKDLKRWLTLIGNKNPALYATLSKIVIDN